MVEKYRSQCYFGSWTRGSIVGSTAFAIFLLRSEILCRNYGVQDWRRWSGPYARETEDGTSHHETLSNFKRTRVRLGA